ncbi:uncharacterized protein V6R79_010286 [Siganus canaliculatus]
MELPSRLRDLHVSSSPKKPLPSPSNRPITELLAELQEKLIGCSTDTERSSVIGQAERLFQTADPDWLFPSAGQDGMWAELQAAFSSLLCALIGCAALPLCEDDCGALPAAAYQSIPSRAEAVCSALTALLARGGVHAGVLLAVAPPICVFAVTHVQDQAWTSSSSRAAAQSLQEALLRAGQWRDSAHLLMGEEGVETRGILGGVLDILQPQMTKDSWHRCEATKFVFVWILQQVSRPSLSLHMPRLLPPSLLLSDHHRPENCILGVRCLHHIVVNTPAADLRQFNRADVLYQALFKHLFTSEAGVVQVTLVGVGLSNPVAGGWGGRSLSCCCQWWLKQEVCPCRWCSGVSWTCSWFWRSPPLRSAPPPAAGSPVVMTTCCVCCSLTWRRSTNWRCGASSPPLCRRSWTGWAWLCVGTCGAWSGWRWDTWRSETHLRRRAA